MSNTNTTISSPHYPNYKVSFIRKQRNRKRKSREFTILLKGDNDKVQAMTKHREFDVIGAWSVTYKLYGNQVEKILSIIPAKKEQL